MLSDKKEANVTDRLKRNPRIGEGLADRQKKITKDERDIASQCMETACGNLVLKNNLRWQ